MKLVINQSELNQMFSFMYIGKISNEPDSPKCAFGITAPNAGLAFELGSKLGFQFASQLLTFDAWNSMAEDDQKKVTVLSIEYIIDPDLNTIQIPHSFCKSDKIIEVIDDVTQKSNDNNYNNETPTEVSMGAGPGNSSDEIDRDPHPYNIDDESGESRDR